KKSPTQTSKKPGAGKKAKRKLNLSPARRTQLAAAMKATWAAKRAAEASATPASADDQHSAADSSPQTPEIAPALAAAPIPAEAARLTERRTRRFVSEPTSFPNTAADLRSRATRIRTGVKPSDSSSPNQVNADRPDERGETV